jgi:hypothetical protein
MLAALSYKAAVRSQEQVITVAQQHILSRQKAASRQHPQRADGVNSERHLSGRPLHKDGSTAAGTKTAPCRHCDLVRCGRSNLLLETLQDHRAH